MRTAVVDIADVLDVLPVLDGAIHLVTHDFRESDDGVQRGTQFMAHVGQKLRLRPVGHLRLFLGQVKGPLRLAPFGHIPDHHLRHGLALEGNDRAFDLDLEPLPVKSATFEDHSAARGANPFAEHLT